MKVLIPFLLLFIPLFTIAQSEPDSEKEAQIFLFVEEMPVYPGGENELMIYLRSIEYPKEAKEKGIEGSVYVSFVIDTEGAITSVKLLRAVHPLLDEATIAHVAAMPNWIPGKQRGKAVKVQYTLPMRFSLGEDEDLKKKKKGKEKN